MGFLLIIESLCLMVASLVSLYHHEPCADAIVASAGITFASGLFLSIIGTEVREQAVGKRESFLVVTLSWTIMSAFGMLPYYLSGEISHISDAYFETMSGFSTTGATILHNIDEISRGLLFWRSLTQWIGGIGIIVFALVLLPMVGGNASVLYEAETTGIVRQRFRPRIGQVAKRLFLTYVFVTTVLIVLLWLGPMSLFDSICHALSTMSTGGYSTKQDSISYWSSSYVEYVLSLFMFVGGVNFALIYFLLQGAVSKIVKDEEFRWYAYICLIFTGVITTCLLLTGLYTNVEEAFRTSLFQVVSIITTTGFATADYVLWGSFYTFAFTLLMFFCACAGSTSGGMKIVRMIVLCKNAVNEFKRQVHPNAVLPVRLNGTVIPIDTVTKVLAFMFLYIGITVLSFLVLSMAGMGFEESVGAAISSISNVGPGLGEHGPSGHYAEASAFSKWYMSFLMLTGRLELFTVLSLFMPAFWKR